MTSVFLKMKQDREASQRGLLERLEGENKSNKYSRDERIYYPVRDKTGSGTATIRFLPGTNADESESYVKVYDHGWKNKGNGKWFIEDCPTTLGRHMSCPVCEENSKVWGEQGKEAYYNLASQRKRKMHFIANILVVKDDATPENEGKVFMFKFGKRIFDKISSAVKPEFDDETPINVFNPWFGANFKLRVTRKDGQTNYDSSKFESTAAISEDDDVVIEILERQYDIRSEFLNPDKFKSYEELQTRFAIVEGQSRNTTSNMDVGNTAPFENTATAEVTANTWSADDAEAPPIESDDDTKDPIDFFAELADN